AGGRAITVLGQSPWVGPSGTFHVRFQVDGAAPGDELQVFGYSRLTTRTGFDQVLTGGTGGSVIYRAGPFPVSSLPADPAGGFDFDIPVDQQFPTGEVPA